VGVIRHPLVPAAAFTALLIEECALRPGGRVLALLSGLVVIALATLIERPAAKTAAVIAACGLAALLSLLTDTPSQPGLTATLVLYACGATLARRARPTLVASLAAAGAVVLVLGRVDLSAAWAWALALLGLLGWLLVLGIGLGWRVADGRQRVALAEARREERLELARELHDLVAHEVAAIVVQAQAARLLSEDGTQPPPGQLAAIETAGTEALGAMRRVIGLLRDEDAVPLSGPESVADLVQRFAEIGPPVDIDGELDQTLPAPVAGTVYRLVQEGLTNVRLHAPEATRVRVAVVPEAAEVTVSVTDDGPTPLPAADGHGLVGMRERVEALGGSFGAGPQPSGGWAVRAVIPLAVS
jgi:signal transduction histidine kinase